MTEYFQKDWVSPVKFENEKPQLQEVSVMISDLLASGVCFYLTYLLFKQAAKLHPRSPSHISFAFRLYSPLLMLSIALAGFFGAFWHGFAQFTPTLLSILLWKLIVICSAGASLTIICSLLATPWLRTLCIAKYVTFLVWMTVFNSFTFIILESVPNVVAGLVICVCRFKQNSAYLTLFTGLLSYAGSCAWQASGYSPFSWLTFNDVYHLGLILSMSLVTFAFWVLMEEEEEKEKEEEEGKKSK